MNLLPFFKLMAERNASDLFLAAQSPIVIKIEGQCYPVNNQVLAPEHVRQLAYQLMTPERIAEFENTMEMNFACPVAGVGSFRVNIFKARGSVSMVVRYIRSTIPSFEELRLPPILKDLIMEKHGIILVVGATGSGKSSTMATMLNHRNENHTGHILTIEDPIEFLHKHKKSLVNQREIGIDTRSYHDALRNAMREAPNVLMIGEIRDRETMTHAMQYAQAGHLCISTLHANNSYHSLSRAVNFYPQESREALLYDLSSSLKAIISQRLIRNKEGKLVAAFEVLLNTPRISELIRAGGLSDIKQAMEQSLSEGSQTFEQALYRLYRNGEIELDEALKNADSATNLSWLVNNAQPLEEKSSPPGTDQSTPKNDPDMSFDISLH